MRERSFRCGAFALVMAALTAIAGRAHAQHPVREIPVYVYLFEVPGDPQPWSTAAMQHTLDRFAREVELANRVYANAGIKFTFDAVWDPAHFRYSRSVTLIDDSDPESALGCYDAGAGDIQIIQALATDPSVTDGVPVISPRYTGRNDGVCPLNCANDADCAGVPLSEKCGGGYCVPSDSFASGVDCWASGTCAVQPCTPQGVAGTPFVFSPPASDTQRVRQFAHEVGHHFGLAHTDVGSSLRCYDYGQVDVSCGNDMRATNDPSWCVGDNPGSNAPGASCDDGNPATAPAWKNIMSYHTKCQAAFSGVTLWTGTAAEKWNGSISPDQIDFIWTTLYHYYDRQYYQYPDPEPHDYQVGGYQSLYRVGTTDTRSATGYDGWNGVHFSLSAVGDSGWTKGNVRIVQGDYDCDGVLDAVVSAASGPHAGTWYWRGSYGLDYQFPNVWVIPVFTPVRALDAAATPANSIVMAGSFMGDACDDVLIARSTGTTQWAGGRAAALSASSGDVLPFTWVYSFSRPTLAVGNFAGTWLRLDQSAPATPPPGTNYWDAGWYSGSTPPGRDIFDYDDLFVRWGGDVRVYRAAADGSGFHTGSYDEASPYPYSGLSFQAWAANLMGDYHDEVLARSEGHGLHVLCGQSVPAGTPFEFDPCFERTDWSVFTTAVKIAVGDFSSGFRADFLLSAPSSVGSPMAGTRLWMGALDQVQVGLFYRTDLTSDITDMAVADFIRAGYDDVMFTTTSGSYLYAGEPGGNFAWDVWTGAYPMSNWVWFGRN